MASVVPTRRSRRQHVPRSSGVTTRILPAMPSPVVRDHTLPPCVTASRHGFRQLPPRLVGFALEITVIPYVADNNKEWRKCQRRSKQARAIGRRRGRGFGNHLDGMGAALTQAKYLAELFGNSSPAGWAVVWTDDLWRIFYPPDRDQVNVIVITDSRLPREREESNSVPRFGKSSSTLATFQPGRRFCRYTTRRESPTSKRSLISTQPT